MHHHNYFYLVPPCSFVISSFHVMFCIQAHFSQLDLPISDYVTDLKSVLDQSIRIIQAMIDICANSGWLSSSITCMHLLQMVMQVPHSILQFSFCQTNDSYQLNDKELQNTPSQSLVGLYVPYLLFGCTLDSIGLSDLCYCFHHHRAYGLNKILRCGCCHA